VSRSSLRVAIVGCGLIGRKRAEALGPDELVGCFDIRPDANEILAGDFGGKACRSLVELLELGADVVVVAVTHNQLADAACAALRSGAHVLVEKPAGIGVADVDRIASEGERAERLVKVGFNHRFHPGIHRAVTEARSGAHGDVMFARARYGHGGRPGYDREWRADPAQSGGGEIVDQGMHLLDLSYWLLGDLPLHSSLLRTQFWDAPVDDNAVLVLGDHGGIGSTAPWSLLHVSWTEWKNLFSLEIYCRYAKFAVDGLVRSYGAQQLRIYRMRPDLGPPDLEEIHYPERDESWVREWEHFTGAIVTGGGPPLLGDLSSARYAWRCIEEAQR
jgi:predicted dehydrogenase